VAEGAVDGAVDGVVLSSGSLAGAEQAAREISSTMAKSMNAVRFTGPSP